MYNVIHTLHFISCFATPVLVFFSYRTPSLTVSMSQSLSSGDKEKFVTTAYKEKLAEMGRWKAEDSRLEALETATTVRVKNN